VTLDEATTEQLTEILMGRLSVALASKSGPVEGEKLVAALAALAELPAVRCDRCTKRCALEFFDVTEVEREPIAGRRRMVGYTLCLNCYEARTR